MNEPKRGAYRAAVQPPEPLDEMVASILETQEQKFAEQRLSPQERKLLIEKRRKEDERKKKQQARAKEREGKRIGLDLSKALIHRLKEIAQEEEVTVSQVASILLYEGLERLERQEFSFWSYRYPINLPGQSWILIHPKDTERIEKYGIHEKYPNSRKSGSAWGAAS